MSYIAADRENGLNGLTPDSTLVFHGERLVFNGCDPHPAVGAAEDFNQIFLAPCISRSIW